MTDHSTYKWKYKKEYCEEIVEFLSKGKSLTQFAAKLRVDEDTVRNWRRNYPEFEAACKLALTLSQAHWEETGQGHAEGTKQGSTVSWQWQMKNRFKKHYRDNPEVEDETDKTIKHAYPEKVEAPPEE